MKNKIYKIIILLSILILIILSCGIKREIIDIKADVLLEDTKIVDIAAGTDHNLALDQQGNLWAWGRNDDGQVGNGTTNYQSIPIQIMSGHKFKKISAGNGISAAIDNEGYLYVWGKSNNLCSSKLLPFLVGDDLFKDVKCDSNYIRTLLNVDINDSLGGYIKYSYEETSEYTNEKDLFVGLSDSNTSINIWDTTLSRKSGSYSSSSGKSSWYYYYQNGKKIKCDSLCIFFDGIFYNKIIVDGYRYLSSSTTYYMPQIKMSYTYIDGNGKIHFFDYSIVAGESSYNSTTGVYFNNNFNIDLLDEEKFNYLSYSKNFDINMTSIYFVSNLGKLYSIGYNGAFNMLGNSNVQDSTFVYEPIQVESNAKFTKVSAGENHVLALDENGKVYSWGNNTYGQLGHNDTTIRTIPTMIKTFDEIKSFNINAFSNEIYTSSFYQYGGNNYTVVENGSKGSFNIDKDSGEFTYTPIENEYGNDTAVISISYNGVIVNYQVNIYIDRKPVFTGGTPSFNVECGQSFSGNAPATDPDNHSLTYSIIKHPLKGNVVFNNSAGSFTYTAGNDLAGNDSFIIGVSDGYCTVEYPVSVHIQSVITYEDETTINIDLLKDNSYSSNVNAIDIDGDTLNYSISKLPVKGNIVIDNEGNYTYTSDGDKYGSDSFVISIDDGYKPLEVTYNVNIYSVKDNGTKLNNKITKGTIYTDTIKTDAKGVIPTYLINEHPKNGNVNIDSTTGEYTYIPNVGSIGDDSFKVLVDYSYGYYELEIHIYQNSIPNDSNVNLSITTNENQNYTGTVKCSDIDNDLLQYLVKTQPSKGSLSIDPRTGEYTYYPNNGIAGDDSFEVLVDDGTDTVNILISVHIESLISTDINVDKVISQNTTLNDQIIANDKDDDILYYSVFEYPSNGVCNIDSTTGKYTYIPNNDFYGNDKFIIKIDDGVNPVFVEININVNRRPILDKIMINLETSGNSVTGNISSMDPDGDTLFYTLNSKPSQGSVIINSSTGLFAYTPFTNAAGDDTFTIKVSDGCNHIIVNVIVHNETEFEIETIDSNLVVNQGKNTFGNVNAFDPDGDKLNYSILDFPLQGILNLNGNTGAWTYTANEDANGTDEFTIQITDGNFIKLITYKLSINTPAEFIDQNDTNIIINENENYNGKINANDNNGDSLTYIVVSQGIKGNITIDSSTGRFIYVPNIDETGNDSFVLGVNDGNFITEIVFNIHIESDINVPNSTIISTVKKGEIITGNIEVIDKDGDNLTYSISQQGIKGFANVTNDGNWTYFANDIAGDDSFVISVTDGIHVKYITIFVHISTSPIFEENNITISVSDGCSTSGKLQASDEDGDNLMYYIENQPVNGTINLNSLTGEYVYSSFTNISATEDSFKVSVSDGTNISYLVVRVIINNSPEVNDIIINVNQGGSYTGTIEVEDPENDKIEFSIHTQGIMGNANINSTTGNFVYNFNDKLNTLNDSFVVKVYDGFNTKYIIVTVNNIKNKTPDYQDYEITILQGGNGNGIIEGTDYENDVVTFQIYQQGKGQASINSINGEFEYKINDNSFIGLDTFTILVSDGYNEKIITVKVEVLKNERPNGKGETYVLKSDSTIIGEINITDKENDRLIYSIEYQGNKGIAVIDENSGKFKYTSFKDTAGYDCFVISISDGFNKVSYLIEINIEFVDSNNSWAIPTTITLGSITLISITFSIYILLKKKKSVN